jgi:hypothetical protein
MSPDLDTRGRNVTHDRASGSDPGALPAVSAHPAMENRNSVRVPIAATPSAVELVIPFWLGHALRIYRHPEEPFVVALDDLILYLELSQVRVCQLVDRSLKVIGVVTISVFIGEYDTPTVALAGSRRTIGLPAPPKLGKSKGQRDQRDEANPQPSNETQCLSS